MDIFKIDVIQIPYNVADQRGKKYFKFIKKKHIEIQVRSIFLQGALLKKIKSNFKLCEIYNKMNTLQSDVSYMKEDIHDIKLKVTM